MLCDSGFRGVLSESRFDKTRIINSYILHENSQPTHPLRISIGVTVTQAQTQPTDAEKSAYDFNQLSGLIRGDQVDYFSGNWSYAIPLGEVSGAGGLSVPLRLSYNSGVTATDRLIKLADDTTQVSTISEGTVTINNAVIFRPILYQWFSPKPYRVFSPKAYQVFSPKVYHML